MAVGGGGAGRARVDTGGVASWYGDDGVVWGDLGVLVGCRGVGCGREGKNERRAMGLSSKLRSINSHTGYFVDR